MAPPAPSLPTLSSAMPSAPRVRFRLSMPTSCRLLGDFPSTFAILTFFSHLLAPPNFPLFQNIKVKKSHPEATFGETGKILGTMWRALSEAQKAAYKK